MKASMMPLIQVIAVLLFLPWYCKFADLKKENSSVIAVIGDGALTGGMAFEALNNAARITSNFIVVLTKMSISKM